MKLLTFTIKDLDKSLSRTLPASQIHVWMFSLADTDNIRACFSLLSPEEKKRLGHFQKEKDRNRSLIGRSMLRYLLGRYLSYPPEKLCFETNIHGKPLLVEEKLPFSVHFNLSHSGDWIALAFSSDTPIGIDIEKLRPSIDRQKIIRRFFHPKETSVFHAPEESAHELLFFRYWTIREAFLKALGSGFSISPDSFLVEPVSGKETVPAKYRIIGNDKDYSNWQVEAITAPEGYICSICYHMQTSSKALIERNSV